MVSNKLNITVPEELNSNFVPTYDPFLTVLTNRMAHTIEYNSANIRSTDIPDDMVARKVGIGDTERKQVISSRRTKSFNKEYFGIQYRVNDKQSMEDYQNVINTVLNANLKQFDNDIFRGRDNNGVIVSSDPDFVQNASVVANDLDSIYRVLNNVYVQAEKLVGNAFKVFAIMGALRDQMNTFTSQEENTILTTVRNQFVGRNVAFVEVPANLLDTNTPESGFVLLTPSLVRLHFTMFPQVTGNGHNAEGQYVWSNIEYGTAAVEVQAKGGLIYQPTTLV